MYTVTIYNLSGDVKEIRQMNYAEVEKLEVSGIEFHAKKAN